MHNLGEKKKRCASFWNLSQRKTLFVVDVSVNQTAGRGQQTKLLDAGKVTQIHLLRQESIKGRGENTDISQRPSQNLTVKNPMKGRLS